MPWGFSKGGALLASGIPVCTRPARIGNSLAFSVLHLRRLLGSGPRARRHARSARAYRVIGAPRAGAPVAGFPSTDHPTVAIRILLVDDHAVVRQGLRMFLGLDPEFEIVGEATNGAEAVRLAGELRPDVVLMDLLMPVLDGIAATREIRQALPDTEVVALTSVLEDASVVEAVRAGAIGYLLKDTESDELRRAIKAAAAGQVQLAPAAAARLLREVRAPESPEKLSERETDVLRLLTRGRANKEIARALAIGEKTVKSHVSSILGKLGVASRTQAALYAVKIGLVGADEVQRA